MSVFTRLSFTRDHVTIGPSSCVGAGTWGSTTCPWACAVNPCSQSGTTRWSSPGCHTQSSRRRKPKVTELKWARDRTYL